MRKYYFGIAVVVLVAATLALLAGSGIFQSGEQARRFTPDENSEAVPMNTHSEAKPLPDSLGIQDPQLKKIGGIERPARDLNFEEAITRDPALPKTLFPNPGRAPFLQGNENPQVAGLFQELTQERVPREAVSTHKLAKDFDLATYRQDPNAYLDKIRPSRVYESASPAEGVGRIATKMRYYHPLLQGESLNLKVQVDPGMPVTFHAQLGEFANRLTTHTVAADDNGLATATYLAGPGTVGPIDILAASPVHSGQLRFVVDVALPEAGGAGN